MKWVKKIYSFFAKEKEREEVIILDASALKTHKAMEIIEQASKVILLLGTIKELDKEQKDSTDLYIKNKCYVLRKSREDVEGQKYLCILGYEKYSYVDDNIIEYCKYHKNTTILTCDNGLCNKAKAFHISYIVPYDKPIAESQPVKKQKENFHTENSCVAKQSIQKEKDTIPDKYIQEEKATMPDKYIQDEAAQLAGVRFYEQFIRVYPMKHCKVYWKVGRNGKIINPKYYQVGDYIYVCRYKNKNHYLEIIIYQIIEANNHLTVKTVKKRKVEFLNDIYILNLPTNFEEVARNIYMEYQNY